MISLIVYCIMHPCDPMDLHGCIYSLDSTGLLDSPLTPEMVQVRLNLALRMCQFVHYSADG